MKRTLLVLSLLAAALLLAGCRFAVVESGSARIDAPAATFGTVTEN